MPIGKRREFEVFTLSFLDCICCGFGAIILLLVLTDVGQPIVIERSEKDLKGQIDALQRQLFDLRGETDILNREMQGRIKERDAEKLKAAFSRATFPRSAASSRRARATPRWPTRWSRSWSPCTRR